MEAPLIKLKWKMTAYEILSVDPTSRTRVAEINQNFRLLAKKHHPDKGGVPEVFHAIKEAYDCLKDFQKRYEYDRRWDKTIDMSAVIEKLHSIKSKTTKSTLTFLALPE